MSIEIENLLHALNLDRPDIAELPEGAVLACNITTLRKVAAYLRNQINDQPVELSQKHHDWLNDCATSLLLNATPLNYVEEYRSKQNTFSVIPNACLKRLGEALQKVNALPKRESGWQPIETAPKDGSLIIVFKPRNEKAQSKDIIAICKWLGMCWGKDNSPQKWIDSEVTHWMPLPDQPRRGTDAE